MKAIGQDKQSVAWFKLAECIERGEKERALNLFRLLTHSLSNQAFKQQLEADILVAFDTAQALAVYAQAAHLYYQEGNRAQALLLYEHMLTLESQKEFLEKAFVLAQELNYTAEKAKYALQLCYTYLEHKNCDQAYYYLNQVYTALHPQQKIEVGSCWVLRALTYKYPKQDVIERVLYALLDVLVQFSTEKELQVFYADIKALNQWWYTRALEYVKAV